MNSIPRIAVPLLKPEDVIPHLGKPTHWKQGRSAKAVADRWFTDNAIPDAVRQVLNQSSFFDGCELVDAWLERSTDLGDGRGTHSQTDLLAILGLGNELAVMGVEAKVSETFGPLVSEWIESGSMGKNERLDRLCGLFGIDRETAQPLRYQLFHRTAAAIYEAKRYRSECAIMMVHSFCENATGLSDFTRFFETIGVEGVGHNRLSKPRKFADTVLWAGWTSDACPPEIMP